MSFRNRIKFHLVKTLGLSYKEADLLLVSEKVFVNGKLITENNIISKDDEIAIEDKIVRAEKKYTYIALYKPAGIETTLNKNINNSLNSIIDINNLFPIGRLDKASEGLLLLTDNGKIFDRVLKSKHSQEKEYRVKVNQKLTEEFLEALRTGIVIMGKKTLTARVKLISETEFRIILTEGRNRQIRRMCYKYGFDVLQLIRTRIINIELNGLQPTQHRHLSHEEIEVLIKKVLI